ncbi:alkaline phosphatase D family protein [Jiella marina]|uniref:alkaline phosphatase D family protein n=1 Tax=Jiella sp. LLJ827 TaxID=2917712 RepID=UPI00210080EC|nr:alkaline phosphatase D family protein [Jiella sp. LLJ827]MCQ0988407.1 alkaline phosphatase family protein [Jiella sp. LLJ827]
MRTKSDFMAMSEGDREGSSAERSDAGAVIHAGPVLFAYGGDGVVNRLRAVVVHAAGSSAPMLSTDTRTAEPRTIFSGFDRVVSLYEFELPAGGEAFYRVGDRRYRVVAPDAADPRIAYVSCNGQEEHDLDRPLAERDVMWSRLADENDAKPFSLLLQGGDQLYADDVLLCHPEVERWETLPMEDRGSVPLTPEIKEALRRFYFERYVTTVTRPAFARLAAIVPSIMMWDDHDIIDGWGSHPATHLDSPVGRAIFEAAREMFCIFQLGAAPGEVPAIVADKTGSNLGTVVRYPGISLISPDLRSERRPERVMAENGWSLFEAAIRETPRGERLFVLSSVPALGPRMSWLEFAMDIFPGVQQFEDDLRDQWQSRTHREEWRRFLAAMAEWQEAGAGELTVLSGEIHLATRGEMRLLDGSRMHQLVASGISHPAPHGAYPAVLGLLARVGESPLKGRKIRIKGLPGQRMKYVGERNYLVVQRKSGQWLAEWELEEGGRTSALSI